MSIDSDFNIIPLEIYHIDDEYLSWYENHDGHLNYFTGSGRVFSKDVIIKDYLNGKETGCFFYYLIVSSSGDKIGNIKIGPIDKNNKTSDLVCFVGNRKYLGLGIASKVIAVASKLAFNIYDIRRLHGGMFSRNISSIKAYLKAGWFVEATMKGFYWVDGRSEDRVCVACLNPKYFPNSKLNSSEN